LTANKIVLVPTLGVPDWQQRLADPEKHWRTGYSARAMAHSWEAAGGWPAEIAKLFTAAYGSVQPLLVVPEWKTALPGGNRASQSDAFLLARHQSGLVAAAIEGKVEESFGPLVGEWKSPASAGKTERLDFLRSRLGLAGDIDGLHYQLLHRTVSALLEAERFHASDAAMVVHSFSPEKRWFEAFALFANRLGGDALTGEPIQVNVPGKISLVLGWAVGDAQFLQA
jgi:hypothetical protein